MFRSRAAGACWTGPRTLTLTAGLLAMDSARPGPDARDRECVGRLHGGRNAARAGLAISRLRRDQLHDHAEGKALWASSPPRTAHRSTCAATSFSTPATARPD